MARPPKNNSTPKRYPIEELNTTPLMRQYNQLKAKHPDAIMLFRVGDFYETFGEDAVKASRVLGITLTSRNNGGVDIELAGFPYHSLDTYLPKLVRGGYRVAICEQLEKPVAGKVVKRGVTEVITPGVTTDDKLLDQGKNNYLAALAVDKKGNTGIAFLDISTGELLVTEGDWLYADKIFQSLAPSEIIFAKGIAKEFEKQFADRYYSYSIDDWVFEYDYCRDKLLTQFSTKSLKGFGVEDMELAQIAAGAALHYLAATENTNLKHILTISRLQADKYVWLDRFTIKNLELNQTNHDTGTSLIQVLDKTLSPMGARLLKKWIVLPLKKQSLIEQRLNIVGYCIDNQSFKTELETYIRQIGDMERLISKVPLGKINPREIAQLGKSLGLIEPMCALLRNSQFPPMLKHADGLNPCQEMQQTIEKTLVAEPPVNLSKGGVITDGCDAQLDELRGIIKNAQSLLLDIQQREILNTGIPSLKIGFNGVFGYFLEVTNKYKEHDKIPKDWIRKQTLSTGERFITEELKLLEDKILGAEEKILVLEDRIYQELVQTLMGYIQPIQHNANVIAILDCLRSFAAVAQKNNYCRPSLNDGFAIEIRDGRHPVIEQQLPVGETYVPNDVLLDTDNQQLMMITGPNMAGKSALLRQTALICLMAQTGSFVPAKSANLGLLDKIFTRVGASDNISSGESTFMVEMNETASIMNNISERSLILLDEIGRGTSTYDGISIAWSIAEFLHENQARPKTLFATHYHELNELAEKLDRVKNFHVATKEVGQKVIFLRKLTEGGSQHSFGIHVARMAGMPNTIVDRANEILAQLESKHIEIPTTEQDEPLQTSISAGGNGKFIQKKLKTLPMATQLNFFDIGDPRLQRIKEALDRMDLNATTPIELMLKVSEWKKMLDN
jgi:DNA mismatch repair protein MutS